MFQLIRSAPEPKDLRMHAGPGSQAQAGGAPGEEAFPLDYSTALRVIRDALLGIAPAPVVVSEGANTMDNARCPAPA